MSQIRRSRLPSLLLLFTALLAACRVGPQPIATTPPPTPTEAIKARDAAAATPTQTMTVTQTPTRPPASTAAPTATTPIQPTPTRARSDGPAPLPDAGPLPTLWRELDLGEPHGLDPDQGTYHPTALALDPAAGTAYALGQCVPDSLYAESPARACLSELDLDTGRVRRTAQLDVGYSAHLLLAGDRLYVHEPWSGDLFTLDRETLAMHKTRGGVQAIAFDGRDTTYALTDQGLARLAPDPAVKLLASPMEDTPQAMAADAARIYLLGYTSLQIFDADLETLAILDLQGKSPWDMALDAAHGKLYVGGAGLLVLDTATGRVNEIESEIQAVQHMALDQDGERLYVLARHAADWFYATDLLAVDLDPRTGQTTGEPQVYLTALSGYLPGLALDRAHNRLLVLSDADHALIPIDLRTDQIDPRLPLGIEVVETIVDPATDRVYASDSAGWVHVLDRHDYEPIERLYGGQHISLDAAHDRLYAGDPRLPVVTVWDARSLRETGTIPQSGKPRADPAADEVLILNRRFYRFDPATGRPQGELLPGTGQPAESCPGCYYTIAVEVAVDAQRGLTATTTYTPWPGKPGPRESIDYDPATGQAYHALITGGYVHFSSIATYSDLAAMQARETPTRYLEGLSGSIRLDPAAGRLYVARGDTLFVLDSETLDRLGRVHTAGWTPAIAAVDGELGRLYAPHGRDLSIWMRTGGALPLPAPNELAIVTGTVSAILPSPDYANDRTLLATIDNRVCRSTDGGETWLRLRGGLPEFEGYQTTCLAFSPDYANDRTLFAGIYVDYTHGEGVYRSTDGGESWHLRSSGLYDLRVTRIVPSPAYARDRTLLAYANTQRGEALYRTEDSGQTWQPVLRQESYGTPPMPRPEELFTPDAPADAYPPRFRCDYNGVCERSDDDGQTWQPLDTGAARLGGLVTALLSPHFERDRIVYFMTESDLYRYREDAQTWEICTLDLFGGRHYARALRSLAAAATGVEGHDLFVGSVDREFYRLPAADLTWEPARAVVDTPPPTPQPCAQEPDPRFELETERIVPYLGCATAPGIEVPAALQPFEQGTMFWRGDVQRIDVLHRDGTWAEYDDTWDAEQPESDPDLVAPEGLYQPVRGFGQVWRISLGGSEAAVGWATSKERGLNVIVQPFTRGLLLLDDTGRIYALYDDGRWEPVAPEP